METCVGEVPQLALAQKIIPALASIVGSSGTVHQLAKEEARALFLADEAHKKHLISGADGVADTAGLTNLKNNKDRLKSKV